MADALKLFGTRDPVAPVRRLQAGRLTADLVSGNLRAVSFAGIEVLRSIAYVVRDRDWGTYDPPILDLDVEDAEDRFTVRYRAEVSGPGDTRLAYAAEIEGRADGTLRFAVEAVPRGDFETNRCGFCILHPIEGVAGTPVEVEHTDGTREASRFPDAIEPWQPFQDIRALAHHPAPGLRATCRLDGDAFEMEDQRAWSDASYKTYVRPLARPWPYRMADGAANRQVVTLTIDASHDAVPASPAPTGGPVDVRLGASLGEAMPRFGLAIAPEETADILARLDRLTSLAPAFLLFHFDPLAGHGAGALEAFARIAALVPDVEPVLELVVPGRGDTAGELDRAAHLVRAAGFRPQTLVVGPAADRRSTPPGSAWPACPPLDEVYRAARAAFPGVRLGGGMLSYFTELNRKRVPLGELDFVTHATNPIVHAADDLSVMQTLEAIPFITRSTRAFVGDKPYRLGPTTIGMRQNPYGSRTMPNPDGRRIPMADDDPRARGLFGAAFMMGYAARLQGAGIEAWTGASLAGPRGLLLADGGVVPAFHAAKGLAAVSGAARLDLVSTRRDRVDGFAALRTDGSREIWLANLGPEDEDVVLDGFGPEVAASRLDETSFEAASRGAMPPLEPVGTGLRLPPYAVVRLVSPQAP
ncbi:D-apionate lactonase [Aureimonas phyllosphaerae]|uniref:Uncharacterized protein n=1 Tax=Aureimonas phyllosphaerae TaxID=1166078 RepID=A0A7W6BTI2_9HYPH|nr:hypothetical protein [Aureimonas phyllosphaerae]MBB3936622.1 hypothetical protein [Aureimonas phyllosphaerae]MBB3960514.1 hypothetical protein [Aureimonas phyllosphaerae]SFF24035.1 hypothetical protein SAMN05216566_105152 [Aureimonas phyllosphaerae]